MTECTKTTREGALAFAMGSAESMMKSLSSNALPLRVDNMYRASPRPRVLQGRCLPLTASGPVPNNISAEHRASGGRLPVPVRTAVALVSAALVVLTGASERKRSKPRDLAEAESDFVDVDGIDVHFRRYEGTAFADAEDRQDTQAHGGERFVAVHGFGSSSFSYVTLFQALLKVRSASEAVSYDSPGFGLTSRPPLSALWKYTPRFGARIVHGFVAAPPSTPASQNVLVGHSLGSRAVSLATTGLRPRAIVLIAPAILALPYIPSQNPFARFVRSVFALSAVFVSLVLNPLLLILLRQTVSRVEFWTKGLRLAWGDPDALTQFDIDGYRKPLQVRGWDTGVLHFSRAAVLDPVLNWRHPASVLDVLQETAKQTPILIVHGAKDRVVPIANSRRLKELIPEANMVEMPDAGHIPHEGT